MRLLLNCMLMLKLPQLLSEDPRDTCVSSHTLMYIAGSSAG